MPVAVVELTSEQIRRRRRLSVIWAVLVVGWSLVRAVIVWAGLSRYGVNPWAYLAIDLASAAIDAVTTPKFVLALIDGKYHDSVKWGGFTLFAFVIPDIYIFKTTRELPGVVIAVIVIVVSISLAVAVLGVLKKVRAGRADNAGAAAPADVAAPQ